MIFYILIGISIILICLIIFVFYKKVVNWCKICKRIYKLLLTNSAISLSV